MHEFESFIYLDVQKTGTSFVVSVLRRFCTEKEIRTALHLGVGDDYDSTKFHFISIRHPLDQYISLYSYGCNKKGQLFARLQRRGVGELYDGTWTGFRHWLDFLLDPENAGHLPHGMRGAGEVAQIFGYQSYRVLNLAMHHSSEAFALCKTPEDVKVQFAEKGIVDYTIRTETIRSDLAELLSTRLRGSISSLDDALSYVRTEEPRNSSDRVDRRSDAQLGKKQLQHLHDREWPMFEIFGYSD